MKRITIDVEDDCGDGIVFITFCRANKHGGIGCVQDHIDLSKIHEEIACYIRPATMEEIERG